MDLNGLPQTVQNFINDTIQYRESGNCLDYDTCQKRRISEDILREVRMLKIPHECSRCSKYVSISQGVFARIPMENNREWDFASRADALLYKAKNGGRDGICLSTEKSSDKCIEIK